MRHSRHAAGLTELQTERLFDRFYTVNTARKSTGLGLVIARTLTEKMGMEIGAVCEDQDPESVGETKGIEAIGHIFAGRSRLSFCLIADVVLFQ